MKKSQINAILVERTKRRKTIIVYASIILILFIIALLFILLYINRSKSYTISYNENSNIDYKVFLKENPFFKEHYLEHGNEYLETLIDYIDTNFNYNASLDKDNVNFSYKYKIDADVIIKTKTGKNPIYKTNEILLKEVEKNSNNESNIHINENIKIDYNHYNGLIKKLISAYSLDNIDATLKVNMHVNISGSCEDFEKDANNESIMSLIIPLTTKTVDIDISDDLIDSNDKIMICNKMSSFSIVFLIISIIIIGIIIFYIIKLIKYIINTRSAEDIYHIELAKILNNYGSYIQEVEGTTNLTGYEAWKIKSFEDMMEISDRVNQPILMIENKDKTGVFFVIPNSDKRLYSYGFKVSDIKQQMKANNNMNNNEVYDDEDTEII